MIHLHAPEPSEWIVDGIDGRQSCTPNDHFPRARVFAIRANSETVNLEADWKICQVEIARSSREYKCWQHETDYR